MIWTLEQLFSYWDPSQKLEIEEIIMTLKASGWQDNDQREKVRKAIINNGVEIKRSFVCLKQWENDSPQETVFLNICLSIVKPMWAQGCRSHLHHCHAFTYGDNFLFLFFCTLGSGRQPPPFLQVKGHCPPSSTFPFLFLGKFHT